MSDGATTSWSVRTGHSAVGPLGDRRRRACAPSAPAPLGSADPARAAHRDAGPGARRGHVPLRAPGAGSTQQFGNVRIGHLAGDVSVAAGDQPGAHLGHGVGIGPALSSTRRAEPGATPVTADVVSDASTLHLQRGVGQATGNVHLRPTPAYPLTWPNDVSADRPCVASTRKMALGPRPGTCRGEGRATRSGGGGRRD